MTDIDLVEVDFLQQAVDVHANGNTVDIKVANINRISVDINLKTLVGGVTPAITFTIQRKDANGNYQNLFSSAAINAVGQIAAISIGPGCASSTHCLGNVIRLSWVVAGAPTGATADVSIIGEN